MTEPTDRSEASSRFPWPPAMYAVGFVTAATLSWLMPLHFLPEPQATIGRIAGYAIVVLCVAAVLVAEQEFRRHHTPALPTLPTRAIVATGIYGRTRNPMYLSMTIGLAAVALAADSLWFVIATPFAAFAVTRLAIEREERYLALRFGEAYRAYCARVRRWL